MLHVNEMHPTSSLSRNLLLQWFLRQIENYFLAAQEQGNERMETVVASDDLQKFAGTKYSASVRDLLKIAFEVLVRANARTQNFCSQSSERLREHHQAHSPLHARCTRTH